MFPFQHFASSNPCACSALAVGALVEAAAMVSLRCAPFNSSRPDLKVGGTGSSFYFS